MKAIGYGVAFLACAALFGASGDALAIDPSINLAEAAGSVCQPKSGTATYTIAGEISNESTTTPLLVDCPLPFLIDDSFGDQLGVWINAKSNGGSLNCTVYVEKLTTGSPNWYAASTSTTSSSTVSLGVNINVFEGILIGVMHAACTLPVKTTSAAKIHGFTILD